MSRYGYHIMVMAVMFGFALGTISGILLVRTGHDPTARFCHSTQAGLLCTF